MEYSIAHGNEMNSVGQNLWPDGRIPWSEAKSPDIELGERHWTGQLRGCPYCGSMHPADLAAAIRAGAKGSWADWKYGWPHKSYFEGIPNPHAGLLEIRGSSNSLIEGWVDMGNGHSHQPAQPAPATTWGKFYTVHLRDAAPEDRAVIEQHLGLHFEFGEDGSLTWGIVNAT